MSQLLTIPEVAQILGIPEQSAYTLARRGMIPVVRIGRLVKVDADKLQQSIDQGDRAEPDESR